MLKFFDFHDQGQYGNEMFLRIFIPSLLLLSLSLSAADGKQTKQGPRTWWNGYLIDAACARERKATETDLGQKHTRKCMEMPACEHSGFGLLTDDNEFLPFDESGNRKVRALLERTNQNDRLRVIVHGTKLNDVLKARKIELRKQ